MMHLFPGFSQWAYLQKAGDIDTGCLHNLTVDNKVEDQAFSPHDERAFLMDLYNQTGGSTHWNKRTGWGDNNTHHCHWYGIQCYPNNTYIKWIDLTSNNLSGTPSNLWKFRNLQGICFSRNKWMTGNISSIIFSNMTRLRRLALSFSTIYGQIPWNIILKLENLEKLHICCTNRRLKGDIPQDIGKLNKLQVFSIGENNIKGPLPASISNLTKLWFLDLEFVQLSSGDLSYFSNMTNLLTLHMTNCGLKATIPKNFGITHPNLTEADLSGNLLEGDLEHCLDGLHNLKHLTLAGNHLRGLLPRSLGSLTNLKTLDLSQNDFSGFQENMTFNTRLEILYLNGNEHLVGDIKCLTEALQPCKDSLRILNVSNCAMKGELPENMWNMVLMTYLDLSINNLTGVIPASYENTLLYLFHLSLATNNFTGDLDPMAFFPNLKVLRYLNIQNNRYLRSKVTEHVFLTYMEPNYNLIVRPKSSSPFSCPSVYLTTTGGKVDMDPSYYDYSLCFCDDGFFGYGNYCLKCMDGGQCQKDITPLEEKVGVVMDHKDHQMEIKMTIMKGYWPCCNGFDDVQRLVKCAKIQGFEFFEDVCNPSGNCKCKLEVSTGGKLKTSCNSSCICHHGSTGRFCSQCIKGFYKRGDVCVQCPEFRKNFPVVQTVCFAGCLLVSLVLLTRFRSHKRLSLVFMFIFMITLTVLHFKSIIPGWFFIIIFAVWILGFSSEGESLLSFICIAVFFFQSLDAMLSEAKIWPESIVLLKYKVTNVFNFELAQLTCSFSGISKPEISYAILLLAPVGAVVVVWLMHILGKLVGYSIQSSTCKRLTIQVLLFMYFPITAKTFNALSSCVHYDGLTYLRDTPWLDCNSDSYKWLVTLGITSLAVFVIGVPICVFAPLLFKNLNKDGEPVSDETDIWLRPLYEEYKPQYRRYFPLLFLARRLLLAVFLSLIPSTSCYQIVGIAFLLVSFVVVDLIASPFKQYSQKFEFENMADVVVSIVLLLSFVGLATLRNTSHLDHSLVWLILSVNFIIVLCCVGGILILFASSLLLSQKQANQPEYQEIPG